MSALDPPVMPVSERLDRYQAAALAQQHLDLAASIMRGIGLAADSNGGLVHEPGVRVPLQQAAILAAIGHGYAALADVAWDAS